MMVSVHNHVCSVLVLITYLINKWKYSLYYLNRECNINLFKYTINEYFTSDANNDVDIDTNGDTNDDTDVNNGVLIIFPSFLSTLYDASVDMLKRYYQ